MNIERYVLNSIYFYFKKLIKEKYFIDMLKHTKLFNGFLVAYSSRISNITGYWSFDGYIREIVESIREDISRLQSEYQFFKNVYINVSQNDNISLTLTIGLNDKSVDAIKSIYGLGLIEGVIKVK